MYNVALLPNYRASALAFGRNSACTSRVRLPRFAATRQRLISDNASFPSYSPVGLQGHAIKNQDLLIASGSLSLKGQEGLSAVDDDLQAAVCAPSDLLSALSADRMPKNTIDLIPHLSSSYKRRIISNRI